MSRLVTLTVELPVAESLDSGRAREYSGSGYSVLIPTVSCEMHHVRSFRNRSIGSCIMSDIICDTYNGRQRWESGNTKTFGVLARAEAETGTFATCVQKEMNYYTPT